MVRWPRTLLPVGSPSALSTNLQYVLCVRNRMNSTGANMLGIIISSALIVVFLENVGDVDMATFFSNLALRVVVPVKF